MATQTQTSETKAVKPNFTRKARIGINPISIEENETKYFEIKSEQVEKFDSKNNGEIDYVLVHDMQTGEEGHFWLSGQLRYNLEKLQEQRKTLSGFKMEVTHKGQKQMEMQNPETGKLEKVKVNQYEMFELN